MYVISFALLILLHIEVVSFHINAGNSALVILCIDGKHHSFPEFLRLHCQVYAWGYHLCYLSFEDAVGFFVLVILYLVQHQYRNPSFKKLSFRELYFFWPEIHHQKTGKLLQLFLEDFVQFDGIVFECEKLNFADLTKYDTVHILGFAFPVDPKHGA